jgi:UDP-glucose 4-epimerase
MKVVVTGSAGHLGEALVRTLADQGHDVCGVDVLASAYTHTTASIGDRTAMRTAMRGADAVLHTATLHKPHVATHSNHAFVDVNISGTVTLLEEALAANVGTFVFTSTTSTFGRALVPPPGSPAAWITEDALPVPKNIYGVTKVAAESLCELFHRNHGLPIIILKTSRFFPEEDDDPEMRSRYAADNSKVNELLYRRVDVADVVDVHLLALEKARAIGFGRYIVSATTPFTENDLADLRRDAPSVVRRYAPAFEDVYTPREWRMFPSIDRVYVNDRARRDLGWRPRHDFAHAVERLRAGEDPFSALTRKVGSKGYHRQSV